MSDAPAHIFLVQFSPSPARNERLNVGLIVVRDDEQPLEFRMDAKAGQRASAIYRAPWASDVAAAQCAALSSRLAALREAGGGVVRVLEGVQGIAGRLANELVVAGPHKRIIESGSEAFDELFQQLVAAPKLREPSGTPRVDHQLSAALKSAGVEDMVRKREILEIDLLGGTRKQPFPYAYENGALHCVLPQRFSGKGKEFLQLLSYTSLLAQAVDNAQPAKGGAVLALYADFETPSHETETQQALEDTNARIWRAGTDDEALADHVRMAYQQHQ